MAGRPKRRAAQLATQLGATTTPAPPADDWGAEVARALGLDAPTPAPQLPEPTPTRAEVTREIQELDRRSLAEWWRDQMMALEAEHQERIDILAAAGDHPSPIYAAMARRFAGIGMPVDVLAFMLGITEGALMEHYETDCRLGEGMFIAPVFANAFRIATSGNDRVAVKMITEIVNRRGGEPWKPPAQKLEIDDARGKKQRVIDSSKLTWEQRQQLRLIVEQHAGAVAIEAEAPAGIVAAQDSDIVEG